MFKSVNVVGWMAVITLVLLVLYIVVDLTAKKVVVQDAAGNMVVKTYPLGIGLKK